jgi:hypothetical protein
VSICLRREGGTNFFIFDVWSAQIRPRGRRAEQSLQQWLQHFGKAIMSVKNLANYIYIDIYAHSARGHFAYII